MTTIAYRNGMLAADSKVTEYSHGMLAADSKVTEYSHFAGNYTKIGRIGAPSSGMVYGGCGSTHLLNDFREWIEGGLVGDFRPRKPRKVASGSKVFIIVRSKRDSKSEDYSQYRDIKLEWDDGTWDLVELDPEVGYACGSGAELAMRAMGFGASASEAVKVASRLDNGTGGKVDFLWAICEPISQDSLEMHQGKHSTVISSLKDIRNQLASGDRDRLIRSLSQINLSQGLNNE